MEYDFKEQNEKTYYSKIKNKWRTNPLIYDHLFYNQDRLYRTRMEYNRNPLANQRRSVQAFKFYGLPIIRTKTYNCHEMWKYNSVDIRNDEKKKMKVEFKKITYSNNKYV